MKFAEWIDEVGVEKLARRLNVTIHAVQKWRRGDCDPKVDQMRRIKKLSRGKIGYDEIIDRPVLTSRVNHPGLVFNRAE